MADGDPPALVYVLAGGGLLFLVGAYLISRTGRGGCAAGAIPIALEVQGRGTVCAGGVCTTSNRTACPQPGDNVQYQATPAAGSTFQRFEGPGGVSTTQNPFQASSNSPGFVLAVFSP